MNVIFLGHPKYLISHGEKIGPKTLPVLFHSQKNCQCLACKTKLHHRSEELQRRVNEIIEGYLKKCG
jgi:hypothetical protein